MSRKRVRFALEGIMERIVPLRQDEPYTVYEEEDIIDYIRMHGYSDHALEVLAMRHKRSKKAISRCLDRFRYTEKNTRIWDYKPTESRIIHSGRLTSGDLFFIRAHLKRGVPAERTAMVLSREIGEMIFQMQQIVGTVEGIWIPHDYGREKEVLCCG